MYLNHILLDMWYYYPINVNFVILLQLNLLGNITLKSQFYKAGKLGINI
ncbi:hypothetical protein Cycma_3645 [Cyclobacterium marinum DSM 745]|uniref:Uncharacterized protein n=1 Tax=Cyclobacterium marinum (strain ATCC 25205 / DSM 745 / LMG 13164 / NCIMB 1802) TaxID=880070 RepID=G0J1G5_CYCMS|nr:hypothetical protein Cycma_3645 [Cyclobacterium marinum DSM 745]